MKTNTTEPDLVEEVDELLASWRPSEIVKQPEQVRDLLRRLKDEVVRVTKERDDARRALRLKSRELIAAKGRCHA